MIHVKQYPIIQEGHQKQHYYSSSLQTRVACYNQIVFYAKTIFILEVWPQEQF